MCLRDRWIDGQRDRERAWGRETEVVRERERERERENKIIEQNTYRKLANRNSNSDYISPALIHYLYYYGLRPS